MSRTSTLGRERRRSNVLEPLLSSHRLPEYVEDADDDEDGLGIRSVEYYERDAVRYIVCMLAAACTCGLVLLVMRWSPVLALKCTHRRAARRAAAKVLVHSTDGLQTVVDMCAQCSAAHDLDLLLPRSFTFRNVRYFEREAEDRFAPLAYKARQTYSSLLSSSKRGLSATELGLRRALFGANLAEVAIKSHLQLLLDEVLHPFYIFQVWSVVVWYLEPYILYATTIAVISIISALFSLFSTRRNLLGIQKMAQFACDVTVLRQRAGGGDKTPELVRVCSTSLVPGDVVEIEDGRVFACDMILASGAVVVNEAMLTGESLPVLKTAIPLTTAEAEAESSYDAETDKRMTLFCGTQAMEARRMGSERVVGIVLRTAFGTAKGRLVRSILYPKPSAFQFYADSFKFVGVMAAFAVGGFLWSLAAFLRYHVNIHDLILNACDVVTIAVPPALPAAMTIGTEFAIERLKAASIFCIQPNRVNVCGQVDLVCFDKTGTLTEEGVDVMGVLPIHSRRMCDLTPVREAPERLLQCLACCHALTRVRGDLIGDPLDLKMFAATAWLLHEPPEAERHDSVVPTRVSPPIPSPPASLTSLHHQQQQDLQRARSSMHEVDTDDLSDGARSDGSNDPEAHDTDKRWEEQEGLAIIKRFDFTSEHQRMSVIARTDHQRGSHMFLKGAPEVVRDLCDPTTVPPSFSQVVQGYTRQGLRVLACAHGYDASMTWHKAERTTRDKAEQGLTLLGILILENRIKAQTNGVIEELNRAGIRSAMVTGDHILTAITVARACGMIESTRAVLLCELVVPVPHHQQHAPPTGHAQLLSGSRADARAAKAAGGGGGGGGGLRNQGGEDRKGHEKEREKEKETAVRFRLLEPEKGWGKYLSARLHTPRVTPGLRDVAGNTRGGREECCSTEGREECRSKDATREQLVSTECLNGIEYLSLPHLLRLIESPGRGPAAGGGGRGRGRGEGEGAGAEEEGGGGASAACERSSEAARDRDRDLDFEVAVTGAAFQHMRGSGSVGALYAVMQVARVYARMSPEHKQALVEGYAGRHGLTVAMCGDGANDCGALKAAHVGLSLSEAEASIAAPFTSSTPNIAPLVTLMREGRAALVTSVSCFKFMALYSSIQFITVMRLYQINTNMSDMQYLWIDLCIIFPLAITMGRTHAYPTLSEHKPNGRLISFTVLASVLGHTALSAAFQALAAWWTFQVRSFHCDDSCPADSSLVYPSSAPAPASQLPPPLTGEPAWALVALSPLSPLSLLSPLSPLSRSSLPGALSPLPPLSVLSALFGVVAAAARERGALSERVGLANSFSWRRARSAFPAWPSASGPQHHPQHHPQQQQQQQQQQLEEGEMGGVGGCDTGLMFDMAACCFSLPLGCKTRPISEDTDDNILSFEATSAFLFSQFQYLSVLIAFNRSKPYRQSLITNFWFFLTFVVVTVASILLLLLPDNAIETLCRIFTTLELAPFPNALFKFKLLALAAVNTVATCVYESLVDRCSHALQCGTISFGFAVGAVACGAALIVMLAAACLVIPDAVRYT